MAKKLSESDRTLRLVAFIFALINTISIGMMGIFGSLMIILTGLANYSSQSIGGFIFLAILCFLPLAWMIPMTVHTFGLYNGKKQNTIAFGVCSILFLNLISGILLLCSSKK